MTWLQNHLVFISCFILLNALCSAKDTKTNNAAKNTNDSSRLPTALKPVHYDIELIPYINGNLTIKGKVKIVIKVENETDKIVINMADIITKNDTTMIKGIDGKEYTITTQAYDPKKQFYIITLNDYLSTNETIIFETEFEGLLNDKLVGFYRSSYLDKNGNKKMVAATQFSPTDARKAFPCFDEPSFKATFSISLGRWKNMTALSNMPLIESNTLEGYPDWVIDHFNTTLRMSTYLIGFLVCDFGHLNSSGLNHTEFKVWSRPEALDQAEYAREKTPEILTFLENYFSLDFPLPKLDMAAIPDFKFSGMENWGLIMYRETAMLYDSLLSSASQKLNTVYVIAHEIAHQWFGNLVTPVWWSDLWLKEGFASFMGYVALNQVEPTWNVMSQFLVDYLHLSLSLDSLESSHPINVVVDNTDQISEIFDIISYRKGASLIRMMQHFLTESSFRKGLTAYLNDLKYSNAEQDDLWSHLTEAAHSDGTLSPELSVKDIMNAWTLEKGYPLLNVNRNGSKLTLTQNQFYLIEPENQTESRAWWIPITYTTDQNSNFNDTLPELWFKPTDNIIEINDIPLDASWVIFNIQQAGYYRVNYDIHNWREILQTLQTNLDIIPNTNRAQIISDVHNIARAGDLDYEIAMDATLFFEKETDYVAWSAFETELNYIFKMFSLAKDYGSLADYTRKLINPLYEKIKFEDNIDEPYLIQATRVLVVNWACALGISDCEDKADSLFQEFLKNSSNIGLIGPNIKFSVLKTGIRIGGVEEWNKLWEIYIKSNNGAEKEQILSALGSSKEVWILARYLEMCFDETSGVRKQDISRVFGSIASNTVGKDLAWNYLRENWIQIRDYVGSGSNTLSKLVTSASQKFNTDNDVKELEEFQHDYDGEFGSAVRALSQAIENAKANTLWMKKNYDVIVSWLNNQGFSSRLAH